MRHCGLVLVGAALAGVVLCACASPAGRPAATSTGTATVWLCRPGAATDPCAGTLDWTTVTSSGARTTHHEAPAADPPVDCFYVYPTVSTEPGDNADLRIQPAETDVAVEQASRFSSVCRVWAPMYRQHTLSALTGVLRGNAGPDEIAYASVVAAWQDYLAHDNDGRPVVLIGHSQGATMLIRLLAQQVDGDAALRARLVSAILLGGNVTVPKGAAVGGSFAHIPLCTATSQSGCVVAYSSFLTTPPANSLFGIAGQGVDAGAPATGMQVACVNPAAPGGADLLDPFFATTTGGAVHWFEYPALYSAHCESDGNATWLQVDDVAGPGDTRPRLSQTLGPRWGLHLDDVNVALGNLVGMVGAQVAAYEAATHG
jgi:hypothetical protein